MVLKRFGFRLAYQLGLTGLKLVFREDICAGATSLHSRPLRELTDDAPGDLLFAAQEVLCRSQSLHIDIDFKGHQESCHHSPVSYRRSQLNDAPFVEELLQGFERRFPDPDIFRNLVSVLKHGTFDFTEER